MARVYPDWDELACLPTPLNVGERLVLDCLAALDDEWIIYVQPRLGLDQPDFITAHPTFGVCAVEVKDWSIGIYRQDDDGRIEMRRQGGWVRTDEAPRYQAHRYRGAIHERLTALTDEAPPFAQVRGVVVMPRCTTWQAKAAIAKSAVADGERWVEVYGYDDLQHDPTLVLTGSRQPVVRHVTPAGLDALRRSLAEPEAHSDQRLPLSLSAAAANIEANPRDARIRRVRGSAGCGKSLGLAARAARLSLEGKEVLVLTYNSTLPHYLRDLAARRCRDIGASLNHITFTHLHELCHRAVDDARLAGAQPAIIPLPGVLTDWEAKIDQGIEAYRLGYGPRFDAVLVDEGQDFSLKWWNMLRQHVCRPDGELLLVADPTQDVYGQRAWTDEERMLGAGFSGPWTELRGSYRMPPDLTPLVAEFAQLHLSDWLVNPAVPSDHPQRVGQYKPTVKRWVNTERGESCGKRLGAEVVRMLRENPDLAPSDVVFLANHREGLEAVKVITDAGYDVQHVFGNTNAEKRERKMRFYGSAAGVKGCTVHSFKGWESRAVLMSVGWGDEARRLAYVGLTRVKGDRANRSAFVTVVNSDFGLRSFQQRFEQSA
ncbi:MAG: nuclease-related domain-containing protein [Ilumatobacteraceae bacterium]